MLCDALPRGGDGNTAILIETSDTRQEEVISAFFDIRSIAPLVESAHVGTTNLVFAVPSEVMLLTALVTELLRDTCALGEHAPLSFVYHDIENEG